MKRNIKQTLLAPVALLLAAALGMAGCTNDDDFGRLPQGSVPLVLGDVTVAGMKAVTRADISENATGYTGIRKSSFKDDDVLNLTLSNDGGTTDTSVTATLTGGAWVLSGKVYVIPGTTTIRATHAGAEVTAGIKLDALEATEYTLDGRKVTFAMKHANAMIDITPPRNSGVTITSITVAAHNGTADETLTTVKETERSEADVIHYRTIALPGTVKSLTAVINGQSYVATLATPLTVEANKKYPISLTFKENRLSATVGTASTNWGIGGTVSGLPAGYDRVIRTPEDLAQLAKDVNDGTVASNTSILQTANIDLSQLKPAAEAGINPLTGSAYTYTATADAWVSIGESVDKTFSCKYNGNGHIISNLKGSSGLFGSCSGNLTGIHLRNVSLTGVMGSVGALANTVDPMRNGITNNVTLCSATGSITATASDVTSSIGGLIGVANDGYGSVHITRCSADVDIDALRLTGTVAGVGGFVGRKYCCIVGCMATGDVESGSLPAGGFAGSCYGSDIGIYFCMATGNVKGSSAAAFAGYCSSSVYACYATGTVTGSGFGFARSSISSSFYQDCAYTGTQTTSTSGITGDVAVADIYDAITTGNASAILTTLHWSAAEGYTMTEVTNTWDATDVWKDNGTAAPTIDMAYEGFFDGKYEGEDAHLLAIPGQIAYWVAPVDVETKIDWGFDPNTACPKGWHVPTKDEFVAMTGLPADDNHYETNNAAIVLAFPAGDGYWSSTEYGYDTESDIHYVWHLLVYNDGNAGVQWSNKEYCRLRCVRAK